MLQALFSAFSKASLKTQTVNLGSQTFHIPVMDVQGERPGKTLLVTAGMDGDEYVGIKAAYQLIEQFQAGAVAGRLIIIPIVNVPGFEALCSQNPLDQRYPKSFFPGRAKGSPTERLVDWLATRYVSSADVWCDLHSGSLTERLNPFLWTFETRISTIDDFMKSVHTQIPADRIVFESAEHASKGSRLARQGCAYVMAESGDRLCQAEDVARHVEWVRCLMRELRMIEGESVKKSFSNKLFRTVEYVYAPCDGLWYPQERIGDLIQKGDLIGVYTAHDQVDRQEVRAKTEGNVLWWKETLRMKRGDVLCAFAR